MSSIAGGVSYHRAVARTWIQGWDEGREENLLLDRFLFFSQIFAKRELLHHGFLFTLLGFLFGASRYFHVSRGRFSQLKAAW